MIAPTARATRDWLLFSAVLLTLLVGILAVSAPVPIEIDARLVTEEGANRQAYTPECLSRCYLPIEFSMNQDWTVDVNKLKHTVAWVTNGEVPDIAVQFGRLQNFTKTEAGAWLPACEPSEATHPNGSVYWVQNCTGRATINSTVQEWKWFTPAQVNGFNAKAGVNYTVMLSTINKLPGVSLDVVPEIQGFNLTQFASWNGTTIDVSDMILGWNFTERVGAQIIDMASSGGKCNLTMAGNYTYVAGMNGGTAVDLAPATTQGWGNATNCPNLPDGNAVTMTIYVAAKRDGWSSYGTEPPVQGLFSMSSSGASINYHTLSQNAGYDYFRDSDSAVNVIAVTAAKLGYFSLTATKNATDWGKIFYNGSWEATSATAMTGYVNPALIMVGNVHGTPPYRAWNGTIECVYMWNRVLNASEIHWLHENWCTSPLSTAGAADTTPPAWSDPRNVTPANYSATGQTNLSINWSDASGVAVVLIEANISGVRTNYTATNQTPLWNITLAGVAAGTHNWRSIANDTSGNVNASSWFSFTIAKATPSINLTLNGTAGNVTISKRSIIWLNGTRITGDGGALLALYVDGALISNATAPANLTNFTTVGAYAIMLSYTETGNFSFGNISHIVTAANTAPTAPVLASPANASNVTATSVLFTWAASNDSDMDQVNYTWWMDKNDKHGDITGLSVTVDVASGWHNWSVMASDGTAGSANSTFALFQQANSPPPSSPGGGGAGGMAQLRAQLANATVVQAVKRAFSFKGWMGEMWQWVRLSVSTQKPTIQMSTEGEPTISYQPPPIPEEFTKISAGVWLAGFIVAIVALGLAWHYIVLGLVVPGVQAVGGWPALVVGVATAVFIAWLAKGW